MKVPFVQKLIGKLPKLRPKTITCKRCLRLARNGTAPNAEHDNTVKGHTCDHGCNYTSYNCFSNPEFAPDVKFFDSCRFWTVFPPQCTQYFQLNERKQAFQAIEANKIISSVIFKEFCVGK